MRIRQIQYKWNTEYLNFFYFLIFLPPKWEKKNSKFFWSDNVWILSYGHQKISPWNFSRGMPYLRNSVAYDHDFWCTCVKWWYLQVFFFSVRGEGKGQKMAQWPSGSWSNGLVVKVLDFQFRSPVFETTVWL